MQTDYSSLFTAGLFQLCPHDQSEQPQQQRRASSNDSSVLASPTSSARPSRRPTISEQYRSFLSFDVAESLRSLTLSRNDSWSFKSWTSSRSPSQPRVLTSEPALLHPQPKRSLETLRKSSGSPDSARSRRSLPSPKPAPSSPLPAAPSFPLTPSTASSPILPSQRLPTPPPPPSPSKFTPKAAPAYTPTLARSRSQRSREAGITHSAPAPSSSEIDSLRTVSTNYKRTKRSDALAKLEGRHHVRRESGGVPALPPLPSLGELDLGINIPILATEASSPPRPKKRVSKLGVDNSKSRNRRITMMGSSTTPSSFIPFIDMDVDADMEVESAEIDAESNLHPDADTCGRTELIEESFNLSLPHAHIHPHSHSHSHHRAHSQSEADEEEEVEVEMEMEGGEDIDPLAYAMSLSSLSPPPSTTLSMLLGCNDSSSPTYSTFSSAFSMSGASGVSRGRGRSTKARNGKRRSSSERFPRNFMDMGDADSIWSPSSHSSHSASLSLGSIPIFV